MILEDDRCKRSARTNSALILWPVDCVRVAIDGVQIFRGSGRTSSVPQFDWPFSESGIADFSLGRVKTDDFTKPRLCLSGIAQKGAHLAKPNFHSGAVKDPVCG